MERRKGQIGKVSTGKRTVPAAAAGSAESLASSAVGLRASLNAAGPMPIKAPAGRLPTANSATSSFSSFHPSQPLPESAEVREYSVRVPKSTKKQHSLMRFNGALNVDFSKWTSVRIQREDNSHLHKLPDFQQAEMPKFGAGSEFGREQREEARRRKYGMNRKKYVRENQPWVLKAGTGDTSRKFKGLREGGVNENASYFIFTQAQDGCFEVFPIKEWFNFTPIQRYKALSAEEAEEQFSKRSKILNLFSVMVQKRMREDKDDVDDEKPQKGTKASKSDMQVTDMDDWVVEEMDEGDDSGEEESEDKPKKAKPKKKAGKKKKDSDDELDLDAEDSDDGDEEGREQDYMSDVSSESEDEEEKKPDLPGIDQDDNMRSLFESESSSEDDDEKKKEEVEGEEAESPETGKKKKNKKKKKGDKKAAALPDVLALDEDAPPEDAVEVKPEVPPEVKVEVDDPNPLKRKAVEAAASTPKKPKVDLPSSILQLAASEGITEEAVKKYLLRKPMTIAELLQKFKPKKSKISSNDLVPVIAHILKKLNPAKRSLPNKTYFFINNKAT